MNNKKLQPTEHRELTASEVQQNLLRFNKTLTGLDNTYDIFQTFFQSCQQLLQEPCILEIDESSSISPQSFFSTKDKDHKWISQNEKTRPSPVLNSSSFRLSDPDIYQANLYCLNPLDANKKDCIELLAEYMNQRLDLLKLKKENTDLRRLVSNEKGRNSLLHSVAHDLRTPLTSIMGLSELIMEDSEQNEIQEFARDIKIQSKWLNELLENILSLMKMDQKSFKLHKSLEIFQDIVDEAIYQVRYRLNGKTIRFHAPDSLVLMEMDSKLMIQAIINLIDNAIHYSPDKGTIDIELKEEGDSVLLTVSDEGPGIEEKNLPRLFDAYFTTRSTSKTGKKGTGLGLSICRAILKAHNGTITAANKEKGTGAVFTLKLPASKYMVDQA